MANVATSTQTVHAGHTILLKINGTQIGRAQGIDGRRSYGNQPVHEIGTIMPVEHVQNQFEGTVTLDRYFVRAKSLSQLGIIGEGEDVLRKGLIDIEVQDKATGKVIKAYEGCTLADHSETFRAGQISGENASWNYLRSRGPEV